MQLKKLKIGITIDVYDAINGGVISTQRIVEELRNRGHEVYIFAAGNQEEDEYFFPMKAFYVPLAKGIMKRLKMPLARPIYTQMEPIFKELDIVHYMFPFWLGYASLRLAKKYQKPSISTFHVQVEHIFKNIHFEPAYLVRKGYELLVNKLYNHTDFIFCPSKFAHEELIKYNLKSPSQVLSNGVSSIFSPREVNRPNHLKGKFLIISVGRLTPEKSHKTIIEAISKSEHNQDIQLLIFGEGPQEENLRKQAETLVNPVHIEVVDAQTLSNYYNMADLYIHASEIETEGMAPLEASACGTPLLISDSEKSASRQFALDPQFLFPHDDATALQAKIDHWINNKAALENWGHTYAEEAKKYHISQVVDVMEAKYYELVNQYAYA